jgi:flagellar motor component MotA
MNKDEIIKSYYTIFERALYFTVKSRVEGLLSLEDEIDNEKVDKRDIFEYGIRFIIDGTDINFIDKILSNIIKQEKDENTVLLKTIQKEAVLSIEAGYHRNLLIALLNSYVDIPLDDPEFIKISEKAEALEQEIKQSLINKNNSIPLETAVSEETLKHESIL